MLNVAVVLDFSKYLNRVLEIDPERRLARVEPGVVLDDLREAAAGPLGLTFGPDPSTHDHCTLGGMIGNNSCGVHSVMSQFYGPGPRTSDNVAELEVLTYRGERLRVGADGAGVPRRARRAAARRSPTATATWSASATRRSRGASRATTSTTCCPRTASTSPVRSSAPRAPA